MQNNKTVLKVAIAAAAVVGGSFLGAAIGVPMLSLAAQSGEEATPAPVTGTVDDAMAPLTDEVQRAPLPAPGQTGGEVAPAEQAGDDQRPAGPHAVGDCTEEPLSDEDEAKVRAAVEEEVPGATIDRIETECDGQGVYEAHLTRSDGTRATAFLNGDFEVTSVQEGMGPGGPGRGGPPPGGQPPAPSSTTDSGV